MIILPDVDRANVESASLLAHI